MVDYWPSEEGAIVEGGLVLNCTAAAAISEGSCVKWGTAAANTLPVAATAAYGDSCGVALKAATAAGDIIPVCFHGLVKMMLGETLVIGDAVIAMGTTGKVYGIEAASSASLESVTGATVWILGYCFGGGIPGDEIPVLISLQ
jgi:hypothetical protein